MKHECFMTTKSSINSSIVYYGTVFSRACLHQLAIFTKCTSLKGQGIWNCLFLSYHDSFKQVNWDKTECKVTFNNLLSSASVQDKAGILAVLSTHSHDWLCSLPII